MDVMVSSLQGRNALFSKCLQKYGDKVSFIMINATSIDDLSASDRYLKENQYDFPVFYDFEGNNLNYLTHETGSIPQTYVLDKNNYVIFAQSGVLDSKAKAEIIQLISE